MRLSPTMVARTLSQFEAQAIPDNHPSMPELNRTFGDHTFFLDGDGLHIVEPAVSTEGGTTAGKIVKLASWQGSDRTSLVAHEPEPTDVVVELGSDGSSPGARH
jgi:hypothetical protein